MNAQFSPAFEMVLREEGGYSSRDNNNGAVNMGITQKTWNGIRARGPIWMKMPEDVKDLTRDQVCAIYRDCFWHPSGAWRIRDQRLANAYFVAYINVRWGEATRAIQRAVGVQPDGSFGQITADAVNSRHPADVLKSMNAGVMEFYRGLAAANPALYADDLPGWEKRLKRMEEQP